MVASEVRDPQRNLPLGFNRRNLSGNGDLFIRKLGLFPRANRGAGGANPRVAAEMMRRILGDAGANAVSVAAMISIFAALNGSILTGSRVPYAAARDGYFFRAVAYVHPTSARRAFPFLCLPYGLPC